MVDRAAWLERVEECPVWVEARALLLDGTTELRVSNDGRGFVVLDRGLRLGNGWGEVARQDWQWLAAQVPAEGSILSYADNTAVVREMLDGWEEETAYIHALSGEAPPPLPGAPVRWATTEELEAAPIEDPIDRADVLEAARRGRVAACFVGGQAVCFCYAAVKTEHLWDLGIDTLPGHRRRGYAEAVCRWIINEMKAEGARPVWGAVESNAASRGLAHKLGFAEVGQLTVWERPEV